MYNVWTYFFTPDSPLAHTLSVALVNMSSSKRTFTYCTSTRMYTHIGYRLFFQQHPLSPLFRGQYNTRMIHSPRDIMAVTFGVVSRRKPLTHTTFKFKHETLFQLPFIFIYVTFETSSTRIMRALTPISNGKGKTIPVKLLSSAGMGFFYPTRKKCHQVSGQHVWLNELVHSVQELLESIHRG